MSVSIMVRGPERPCGGPSEVKIEAVLTYEQAVEMVRTGQLPEAIANEAIAQILTIGAGK